MIKEIVRIILFFVAGMLIFSCQTTSKKAHSKSNTIKVDTLKGNHIFNGVDLSGWEISEFGTQGPVMVSEGNIVLNFGDGLTGVTYKKPFPRNNYKISVEAKKVNGNDFFCGITFPFNETYCSFIVGGWGGPVVGLSTIDGKDASENETQILKNFEKNVWYKIELLVKQDSIFAWIDEEKVLDFSTQNRDIYIRPEVGPSLPFGISSWNTTATLRNIQLFELE